MVIESSVHSSERQGQGPAYGTYLSCFSYAVAAAPVPNSTPRFRVQKLAHLPNRARTRGPRFRNQTLNLERSIHCSHKVYPARATPLYCCNAHKC